MGILSAFNTKPKQEVEPASNVEERDYNPGWLQAMTKYFMSQTGATATPLHISETAALTVSAVYSAVKLLSELPASLDIQHMRLTDDNYYEAVKNSRIARALRQPNTFQTNYVWTQSILAKLLLRGNAWCYIDNRETLRLIPVYENQTVETLVSPNGDEVFYKVNGVTFASYEILHFKGMSIDGVLGLSPISYAARMLKNAIDSERYMQKVYENGIVTTGFFTTAERLNKQSYERLKKDITEKSGIDRAGEAAILDSGLKFERHSLSAADGAAIEQMGWSVQEVARIYRIPPYLLGVDQQGGSTRSFSQQAREFLTYSLSPLLNNMEEELAMKLLPMEVVKNNSEKIEFDTKALLRVDPTERGDYYKAMFNVGAMTPNEIRAEEGMAPIEGGDTSYIPLNLAPADMIEGVIADKLNKQIDSTNG